MGVVMLNKPDNFIKMLLLLSALAFSATADALYRPCPPKQVTSDYSVTSTDHYTRIDILNLQMAQNIYSAMRLQEEEHGNQNGGKSKYKSFANKPNDNKPTDFLFFCGTTESSTFSCYFQIEKNDTDRLFESPSVTSLKLNAVSGSKQWTESLPLSTDTSGRIISILIIENYLETYCEKSSLNDEELCHITIYKKNGKSQTR